MAGKIWRDTETPSFSPYGSTTTGTEPNMRQEMINFLDGKFPEVAKAQTGLLRKMRLDSDGDLIPCSCVDDVTGEPDKDRFCPICFGEAYLWDETRIDMYRVLKESDKDAATANALKGPGLINAPLVVFYVRHSVEITNRDKIVEFVLTSEGAESDPLKRRRVYRIARAWDYRADNGKIEFWKAFTHEDSVKYLNAPEYGDA